MGLFNKLKEPVFLKEDSDAEAQLEKLKALEPLLNAEGKNLIKQDIKNLEYGIVGEKNIAFELKNSHMPMYVLHDLYLEVGDLSAQIDYLVVTRKLCFIIECKNLYGNIEINSAGDFIRTMEYGGRWKKEGIYSPITQNQRHMELIKKIKMDRQKNVLVRLMVDKSFGDMNQSIIVLANPKTVLNARFAKKGVKEQVIRADQLVKYIKDACNRSKEPSESDEGLLMWAKSYLSMHKEREKEYTAKYEKYRLRSTASIEAANQPVEETAIFKELRAYRLKKSREEKIKPYFICNDSQLRDLIWRMPENMKELQAVSGFGKVKSEKYGAEILEIVGKYRQK